MFETVAVARPADPGRQLSSIVITLLLNGCLVTSLLVVGRQVVEQVAAEDVSVPLVFLEALPSPAPGPAAPAPRPPTPRAPPTPTTLAQVTAPTSDADPKPGPPAPAATAGTPLDEGGGGGEGEGEQPGADGPGTGPREVHWSEVTARVRSQPRYPEAAKALGIEEGTCTVHMVIDEQGKPSDVSAECSASVFEAPTLQAAWQWRFYPMKVQGRPTPAAFVLKVQYHLR